MADQHKRVVLTRDDLYQQVWTTPMRELAPEYGLSDVGLAKICKRLDVPRPGVGYWAKKRHGKRVRQKALPEESRTGAQSVTLYVRDDEEGRVLDDGFDDEIKAWLERAEALPEVKVPERLSNPHPLVASTRAALKERSQGVIWSHSREKHARLDLAVSDENTRRALRYLNSLLKAAEKLGGAVRITGSDWRKRTVVELCGEEAVTVRVRELCRQVPAEPGAYRKHDLEYTGVLVVDGGPSGRIHCKDGKTSKIEDQINNTLVWWIRCLGHERNWGRQREEEERIRQAREAERRRVRKELEMRQQAERERVDRLLADVHSWRQSEFVREYVTVVCRRRDRESCGVPDGTHIWGRWALAQADRMDPLKPSPKSVLDERLRD